MCVFFVNFNFLMLNKQFINIINANDKTIIITI